MQNPQKKKFLSRPVSYIGLKDMPLAIIPSRYWSIPSSTRVDSTCTRTSKDKKKSKQKPAEKKGSSYLALLLQLDRRIFQRSSQHDLGVLTTSFNPQGELDMTIEIKMAKTNQKKNLEKKSSYFTLHASLDERVYQRESWP